MRDVVPRLEAAHAEGVVQPDLKPQNIHDRLRGNAVSWIWHRQFAGR